MTAPQPTEHSAATESMPVVPNMMPPPPDAPPAFTDDPLIVPVTVVQALHITELRDGINLVRARAGLTAASWDPTFPVASGLPIKATHILELRTRLDEARSALGLPAASYSPPAPSSGGPIRAAHVQEIREWIKVMLGSTTSGDATVARLDPANQTGGGGENPLSRNFNWSVPLVGLPGRSGLDLGLSLSYNSLVWTKHGSSISFNDDGGFPSPGFRLGFPVIQPLYYNSEVGKYAFMLITPDGSRTELRQVNVSGLYEASDSSHLLLETTTTMVLRTTDGTQLSYAWMGSDYQCTQIKDRNGNYITINYTSGRIDTVVDTLGRTVKFNYVGSDLTSITQTWTVSGQAVPHYWARFTYTDQTIQTNFPGLTVVGPQNNTALHVLTQVKFDDDSHYDFVYTSWAQVWKVSNFAADGHLLNYRSYDLPLNNSTAQTDCPRFTHRRNWVENWNRSGPLGTSLLPAGPEQEVITTYTVPASGSWTMPDGSSKTGTIAQVTLPDYTSNKIYFEGTAGTSNGWKRGLASLIETYDSGNVRQRQSVTAWTQDDTNVSYLLNPRVTETNIYDPAGNRARTSVTYQTVNLANGTSCRLPQNVYEYQANAATVLRRSHTDYNLATIYTDRRIIGLVSEKTLYEVDPNTGAETLMSKVAPAYDEAGSIQGMAAPVQHDNVNYGAGFVGGRANLSSVKRYDVTNTSQFTLSTLRYNTAGALDSTIGPLNQQVMVTVSYADSFSDGNNGRNTFAYPTTVTDAGGFSSSSQYNFDFGAVTRTQSPPPQGQSVGAIKNFTYDSVARLQKVAVEFGGNADYSHTRFDYPVSQTRVDTYATMQEGLGEAHSFKISDGAGRVIATAADHPGSTGGFSGRLMLYDIMGRVIKQSNPTETNASGVPTQWVTAGDDAAAGWLYTQQTYDWKGRPLITTNTDGTAKEAGYGGCGCAGGEVVMVTDEGTLSGGVAKKRQQKIYADVLGRTVKTEVLNWDGAGAFGTGGSVYSAVVNVYNGRDQVTSVKQYAGAATTDGSCPSGTCQQTTTTYDGHGRLKTRHSPEQDAGRATTYNYNSDDTVLSVVDARGATQTLSYNARRLVTGISYSAPTGITIPAAVSFTYDGVGNRTAMMDGMGSASYNYNQLSRMTSETRTFTGLSGSFTLNYAYNLAGELSSFTDPFGAQVGYNYDQTGRLSAVTGSGFANVSSYAANAQYRAWGALKSLAYGNSKSLAVGYNNALHATSYEVPGVLKKSYQYNDDGRLKFTQDQLTTNSKFDRSYEYDHLGRVTKALSGAEARGGAASDDRPYNETLSYDAMNHLTALERRNWDRLDGSGPSTVANNRVQGFTYDADGRLVIGDTGYYSYDAAGRVLSFGDEEPYKTEQEFTGEGRRAKTEARRYDEQLDVWVTEKITYYLTSTVLDGALVSELSEQGAKERTLVHAGGSVLASQKITSGTESVEWEHWDASGGSWKPTNSGGEAVGGMELDAVGANAGLFRPFTWNVPDKQGLPVPYPGIADMLNNPGGACTLDRMPIPCEIFNNLMDAGGIEVEQWVVAPQKPKEPPTLKPPGGGRSTSGASPPAWGWEIQPASIMGFGLGLFGVDLWGSGVNNEGLFLDSEHALFSLPQNYAQQRQDLKGDKDLHPPNPNIKPEYLTPCVQKYLSKFFGGQSLAGIEVQRDYLPPIAPSDAAAFTNTGSLISFNKGEYQPNTKRGIELIGHEIAHNFQARKYGDAVFGALYLGDSAALLYQFKDMDMAYLGNRFEKEAFAKQAEIEKDLAKNGNPCPP